MLYMHNPDIVHVYCPGTPWRFLRATLTAAGATIAGDSEHGEHVPAWFIDDREAYRNIRMRPQLLRVGLALDPWTWYLRLHRAAIRTGGRHLAAATAYGQGSATFRDVLFGMTHPERISPVHPLGIAWSPIEDGGWKGFLGSTLGLCSFTMLYHYGTKLAWQEPTEVPDFAVDVLLDGHRMDIGLRLLSMQSNGAGPPLLPPTHFPSGFDPRAAYDAQMLAWVAEADRPLIELMGYEHPCLPATKHVMIPVRARGGRRRAATE